MTLASLVVKLSVDAADFHRDMEAVGRRVEMTGRQIARAGHELSLAVSLPILAQGFLAFHAILQRSAVAFGPLYQAFEQLKAAGNGLYIQLGTVLEPVFLKMIQGIEGTITWVKGLIASFEQLSPGLQKVIINTLLFLAYLGPTVLVLGKLIGALGAIPKLIGLLTSATGLWAIAILGLVAALGYVATHWDQTKLQLVLAWTFIEEKVFDAIDGILSAIGFLVDAIPILSKAVASIQNDFEAFSDRTLAKSAVAIQQLEHSIALAKRGIATTHTDLTAALQKIADDYTESGRRMQVMAAGIGETFNRAADEATILKTAIDAAVAAHVGLGDVIPGVNMTLQQSITLWESLSAQGAAFAQASRAFGDSLDDQMRGLTLYKALLAQGIAEPQAAQQIVKWASDAKRAVEGLTEVLGGTPEAAGQAQGLMAKLTAKLGIGRAAEVLKAQTTELTTILQGMQTAVTDAFTAMAEAIAGTGDPIGKAIGKVFSQLLVTTGKAMIVYGTAMIPLQKLLKNVLGTNPVAAIAAGVGLVALGSALGSAAQGAANAASSGGGGASSASASSAYSATQDTGPDIVQFPKGSHIYDASDPDQVERFREFFQNLTGRDVIMQVA